MNREATAKFYKVLIRMLVECSEDMEYLIAVYSFAEAYPDRSKENRQMQSSKIGGKVMREEYKEPKASCIDVLREMTAAQCVEVAE